MTATKRMEIVTLMLFATGCTRRTDDPWKSPTGDDASSDDQTEEQSGGAGTVTMKGSDTMVILAQRWAEVFMQRHPNITVQVTGGGSGTGIAALINGTTDIANASRPMKDQEKAQVQAQRGGAAVETKVAVDALAVYVHESNRLRQISIPELKRIFTGQITNYSQLGGPDRPIVLYGRENNSGTYVYFKEHVLEDADFAAATQTLPGTAAVINAIARDANGIGYGGVAYGQGVRPLRLKSTDEAAPVAPNMQTAADGSYPLSRFLFFYTTGEPQGPAKAFIEWVLSADGQAVIENVGYYPLPRQFGAAGGATH